MGAIGSAELTVGPVDAACRWAFSALPLDRIEGLHDELLRARLAADPDPEGRSAPWIL